MILLSGFFLYLNRGGLLKEAGKYLAPQEIGEADAIIISGGEILKEKAVKIGKELIDLGKANKLVIIIHKNEDEKPFAIPDYTLLLQKQLEERGIKREKYHVLESTTEHPITLTEAKLVVSFLVRESIKSAILVTRDFHARRSLWAYRKFATANEIRIISQPFFTSYENGEWWQERRGIRDFLSEFGKFLYYVILGYIPIQSLFFT